MCIKHDESRHTTISASMTGVHEFHSPWWLNLVQWHLVSLGPQYGTCFMSHFWHHSYEVAAWYVHHCNVVMLHVVKPMWFRDKLKKYCCRHSHHHLAYVLSPSFRQAYQLWSQQNSPLWRCPKKWNQNHQSLQTDYVLICVIRFCIVWFICQFCNKIVCLCQCGRRYLQFLLTVSKMPFMFSLSWN